MAPGSKGVILILIGVFLIGLIDNVLRPILVGRDTKMPDYLILISTLGGISMFGRRGFVMGPVLAALFLVIWQIFMEEYRPGPGWELHTGYFAKAYRALILASRA